MTKNDAQWNALGPALETTMADIAHRWLSSWSAQVASDIEFAGIQRESKVGRAIVDALRTKIAGARAFTAFVLAPRSERDLEIFASHAAAQSLHDRWRWVETECGPADWDAFWDAVRREDLPKPPAALDALDGFMALATKHAADPMWPLVSSGVSERELVGKAITGIEARSGHKLDVDLQVVSDAPWLRTDADTVAVAAALEVATRWLAERRAWASVFHAVAPHLRMPQR